MLNLKHTIFDIGLHKGEDADFYLRKGFQVVGVEANPELAAECEARFAEAIGRGDMVVVNKAIADAPGTIRFFVNNDQSFWGTADPSWAERNRKAGTSSREIDVPATTMGHLLTEYGTPYYMKIDIEGFDLLCIEALVGRAERPRFVSLESHAYDADETLSHLDRLSAAGYTRFKIIAQDAVPQQRAPIPALEGEDVSYEFELGSTGLFGNEVPGSWMDIDQARRQYRRIYRNVEVIGPHTGRFRSSSNRVLRAVLVRVFRGGASWFDTHATY